MKNFYAFFFCCAMVISGCGGGGGGGGESTGTPPIEPAIVTPATLLTIALTPTNPSIAVGTSVQFTATGTFSDHSSKDLSSSVTWSSSAPSVATFGPGSNGLASSLSAGTTTITATSGGVSGTTNLTVTSARLLSIAVDPVRPIIAAGTSKQFTATGTYSDNSTQNLTSQVAWSSSVPAVTFASNAKGLATSSAPGTATITATMQVSLPTPGTISGAAVLTCTQAALQAITITPANSGIAFKTTQQFTATGSYSDNTTQNLTSQVTWGSSSPSVLTISNASGSSGMATTLAAGTTTVSATVGTITGSTKFTVTSATLSSVAVTPANRSIALNTSQQFAATGTFSDGTTQDLTSQATWGSSSPAVLAISNASGSDGMATALTVGTTTVSAAIGEISGATNLTVTSATLVSIAITPANPSITLGSLGLTATGTYSDGSTQNLTAAVTWSSSNTAVASISNSANSNGKITAVAAGSATITAALKDISGTTQLSVTGCGLYTISGIQLDSNGNPVAGASVNTIANGNPYSTVTDQKGNYTLTIPAADAEQLASTFTYTVSKPGYVPVTYSVTKGNSCSQSSNQLLLVQLTTIVLESPPVTHHLGDGKYNPATEPINSQFQNPTPEGITWTKSFALAKQPVDFQVAYITYTHKGVQTSDGFKDQIIINKTTVIDLPDSNRNGDPTQSSLKLSASHFLSDQGNTLIIKSGTQTGGTDFDDFEFVNIVITFSN